MKTNYIITDVINFHKFKTLDFLNIEFDYGNDLWAYSADDKLIQLFLFFPENKL